MHTHIRTRMQPHTIYTPTPHTPTPIHTRTRTHTHMCIFLQAHEYFLNQPFPADWNLPKDRCCNYSIADLLNYWLAAHRSSPPHIAPHRPSPPHIAPHRP